MLDIMSEHQGMFPRYHPASCYTNYSRGTRICPLLKNVLYFSDIKMKLSSRKLCPPLVLPPVACAVLITHQLVGCRRNATKVVIK